MSQDGENIPLRMLRTHLRDLPRHDLPPGFSIRMYRPGDEQPWFDIHKLADFLNPAERFTHKLFEEQFGYDRPALEQRCLFLVAPDGRDIGTATAWYDDDFHGHGMGRVHWVAIVPEFQGRGLAKPLMSAVMERLADFHDRAYLSTNSPRLPAIHLYLKLAFHPFIRNDEDRRGWQQVAQSLDHPLLNNPLTPEDL